MNHKASCQSLQANTLLTNKSVSALCVRRNQTRVLVLYTSFPQGRSHLVCRHFWYVIKHRASPRCWNVFAKKCVIVKYSWFTSPTFSRIFLVEMPRYIFVPHTRNGTHVTDNERKRKTSIETSSNKETIAHELPPKLTESSKSTRTLHARRTRDLPKHQRRRNEYAPLKTSNLNKHKIIP